MSDLSSKPGSLGALGTYTLSEESDTDDEDRPTMSEPVPSGAVEMHDIAVAEGSTAETKSSPSQMQDPEPTSTAAEQEKAVEEEEVFSIESGSNVQDVNEETKEDRMPQQIEDESSGAKRTSEEASVDDNENRELLEIPENRDLNSQELRIPRASQSPKESGSPKHSEDFGDPIQSSQDFEFQNFQHQSPQTYQSAENSRSPLQREEDRESPVRLRTPGRSISPMDDHPFHKSPQTYRSPENPIDTFETFDETSQSNFDFIKTPGTYQSPENPITPIDHFEGTSNNFDFSDSPGTYQSPVNPISRTETPDETSQGFVIPRSPGTYDSPQTSFSPLVLASPGSFQQQDNFDANFKVDDQEDGSQNLDVPKSPEVFQSQEQVGDVQNLDFPESTSQNLDFAMNSPEAAPTQEPHDDNLDFLQSTSQDLDVTKTDDNPEDPSTSQIFDCPESTSQDLDVPQTSEIAEEATDETIGDSKEVEGDEDKMEVDDSVALNNKAEESPVTDQLQEAEPTERPLPSAVQEEVPVDLNKPETPETHQVEEVLPVDEPMDIQESVYSDADESKTLGTLQPADDVLAEEHMDTSDDNSDNVAGIQTPETYQSPESAETVRKVDTPEEKIDEKDEPKEPETDEMDATFEDKAESPEDELGDLEAPEDPIHRTREESPSPSKRKTPSRSPSPQNMETLDMPQEVVDNEEPEATTSKEPEVADTIEKPESPVETTNEATQQLDSSKSPETYQSPEKLPTAEKPASPEKTTEADEAATSETPPKSEPDSVEKVKSPQSSESSRSSEDPKPAADEKPSTPTTAASPVEKDPVTSTFMDKESSPAERGKSSSDSDSSASEDEADSMETDEKLEETKNGKKKAPLNYPWKSPRQEPIDGVVQPRTEPPKGKPTRHTNCLDHLLFTVMKEALKHKHSWPFQDPVDAVSLAIPEYHKTITRPMDLRTIERRLRNTYYWSYEDAVKDIKQIFDNCYKFNPPEYDVYKMAKTLEGLMMGQLARLPTDLNTLFDNCKRFNDRNDDIYIMCENVEGVVLRGLEYLPAKEVETEFPEHQRRMSFPRANGPGKAPKTPKTRGRKSARGRKKVSVPRSASAMNESGDDTFDADEKDDEDEVHVVPEKEVKSRAAPLPVPEVVEEPKPTSSAPPAKKRKLENGDVATPVKISAATPAATPVVPATPTPPTPVVTVQQDLDPPETPPPATPRKNPNSLIDWKKLTPRWQGKPAEWQKFCTRLLNEIHSVKNKSFAQVFYVPVDPIKLKIADYLDVVKNPMDLQTMKKKLDYKQYVEPEEFVHDMNLMIDNCCLYNPKGSAVYQNAIDLKSLFEQRWKLFPRPGVDPIVSDSYINQNLVVNTDLIEDERINSYLAAVRAEEKQCAEKLEQLRSMSEGLYKIATERREARLSGNMAPVLGQNQMTELEKLGISIKNTPVMIPELISPALSVRSSSRAPVPKIIDDIGPSPTKARKISKPRASVASNASAAPYTTPVVKSRGRKPKKAGRAIKRSHYSPASSSPKNTAVKPARIEDRSYKSPYGRETSSRKEFESITERLHAGGFTIDHLTGLLRLIQIGQKRCNKDVNTLQTLCQDEISFIDTPPDMYAEFVDYVEMLEKDDLKLIHETRARLEAQAAMYGFAAYDKKLGFVPKHAIIQAAKLLGYSPSPSASQTGGRSSESDSGSESESEKDSSDSDDEPAPEPKSAPPVPQTKPVRRGVIEISAESSRASTPAGPSSTRPSKPDDQPYQGRTLSESSSSSDSSSASSDSETETKPQVKKQEPQRKAHVKSNESRGKVTELNKKTPVTRSGPPPPKKKPQLTILDDLIPETPASKKPMQASVPSTSKPVARTQSYDQKPNISNEQKHAEALRLRAEARRRKEQEEEFNHQAEVMAEFEFNNY